MLQGTRSPRADLRRRWALRAPMSLQATLPVVGRNRIAGRRGVGRGIGVGRGVGVGWIRRQPACCVVGPELLESRPTNLVTRGCARLRQGNFRCGRKPRAPARTHRRLSPRGSRGRRRTQPRRWHRRPRDWCTKRDRMPRARWRWGVGASWPVFCRTVRCDSGTVLGARLESPSQAGTDVTAVNLRRESHVPASASNADAKHRRAAGDQDTR